MEQEQTLQLADYLNDLAAVLHHGVQDRCPDVKLECAAVIEVVCKALPQASRGVAPILVDVS